MATFNVPLWFNKLDLKSYLLSVYNVSTHHIRSYVLHSPIRNADPYSKYQRGRLYRAKSKKKMTAQLVEPFIWPEEITDYAEWEKEEYWRMARAQVDISREEQNKEMPMSEDRRLRKSVAEQARDLLEGRSEWKSTWESVPGDKIVMGGVVDRVPEQPPRRRMELEERAKKLLGPKFERAPLRKVPKDTVERATLPIREKVEEPETVTV